VSAASPAIRALLFDGDGVLLVGGPFTRALEREHGIAAAALQGFFRKEFAACLEGSAPIEAAIAPYLAACGWSGGVEAFLRFWFETENAVDTDLLRLIDHARSIGTRCYLASNQERRRAAYIAEQMALARRFDGLFFSCDLGVRKPAAAFFDAVAEALAPVPREAILLWDDAVANVEAARAAGLQAELYTTFANCMRAMAGYLGV